MFCTPVFAKRGLQNTVLYPCLHMFSLFCTPLLLFRYFSKFQFFLSKLEGIGGCSVLLHLRILEGVLYPSPNHISLFCTPVLIYQAFNTKVFCNLVFLRFLCSVPLFWRNKGYRTLFCTLVFIWFPCSVPLFCFIYIYRNVEKPMDRWFAVVRSGNPPSPTATCYARVFSNLDSFRSWNLELRS